MSRRVQDWPLRLAHFIVKRERVAFAWGSQDCCLFTCDAVREMTGVDMAADFRGTYTTAIQAARVLKAHGGVERIAERETERAGFGEVFRTLAGRGDMAMTETRHGPALGVCLGRVCAFPGKSGLQFVPTLNCSRFWRIA